MIVHLLQPLIWSEEKVLEGLHSIGLSWGLAIVGLTLLVRLALVPVVLRQLRAQRELAAHLPELRRLQAQHRDDRQRQQRELRAYYEEHGVNPLAPFVPLLVQIPVVVSLYYVMRADARSGLFGDTGFLFIPHLGARPHGLVLLALVVGYVVAQAASSLVATRRLRTGQRGLFLALPLLIAAIVPRAPAGLAVYWVTTALWSLGQQLVVARVAPVPSPSA